MTAFSKTQRAHKVFPMQKDEARYLQRTRRNHHWVGGEEGQKRLQNMRVGIAGLGGMGSNLAEIMVRLGVGHIKTADNDTIEHSNINRQVIANKNTVGQKKAVASANELRNIAEDFELVVYEDGITKDNAEEFVSDLDVVIDEIDVFPLQAHIWLHQAARKRNLPIYSGFIIGMGTHVYKFHGESYTFEDFMQNNLQEIQSPSTAFLLNRFLNPPPSYVSKTAALKDFAHVIEEDSVPIFGATTYMSQSLLAIRLIVDFLNLSSKWGVTQTPIMPQFMKLDPMDLSFRVCDIREQKNIL